MYMYVITIFFVLCCTRWLCCAPVHYCCCQPIDPYTHPAFSRLSPAPVQVPGQSGGSPRRLWLLASRCSAGGAVESGSLSSGGVHERSCGLCSCLEGGHAACRSSFARAPALFEPLRYSNPSKWTGLAPCSPTSTCWSPRRGASLRKSSRWAQPAVQAAVPAALFLLSNSIHSLANGTRA